MMENKTKRNMNILKTIKKKKRKKTVNKETLARMII